MVTTAAAVDWTVVGTEVEALQLEYSWIKEFDPRFNVRYRDDKSYPYLAVTLDEEFPRVQVMRGAKRKGVRYFGPYSHAWAIRETVDLLLRVFPVRTCSPGVFKRAGADRPALPARLHRQVLRAVRRPRSPPRSTGRSSRTSATSWPGNTDRFVKRLEREMREAADELEFERAARLRDDIGALRRAMEKQAVVLGDGTDADVVAFAEDPLEAAVQVFHVRGGPGPRPARLGGGEGRGAWPPASWSSTSAPRCTATTQRRGRRAPRAAGARRCRPTPRRSPSGCSASTAAAGSRSGCRSAATSGRCWRPSRATPRRRSARHKLKRASDLTTRSKALEEIAEALELDRRRCASSATTSRRSRAPTWSPSMVVFEDGLARKSEYRRFAVRGRPTGRTTCAAIARGASRRRFAPLPRRARAGGDPAVELPDESAGRRRVDGAGRAARHRPGRPAGRASSPTRRSWSSSTAARRRSRRPRGRSTSWASTTWRSAGWPSGWRRCGCPARTDPVILPRTARRSTCCSGCATRPTGSPSPTTAAAVEAR